MANEFVAKNGLISQNNTTVTGSLTVSGSGTIIEAVAIGTSSLGPNENTLTLGARDAVNEGGQLGLNAPSSTYASASFLDNYQNKFRLRRGTNASSTGDVANWDLGTLQMNLPAYISATSFTDTSVSVLGTNSSGNVLTLGGWVDYSGTSTIVGFSSYTSQVLQYMVMGKTLFVQFDLRSASNAGSGTTTSFTLPFNSSAAGGQHVGIIRAQNATAQSIGTYVLSASSNVMNFYTSANAGTGTWTNATLRHVQGFAIINIA